tara:strand:+ start:125 stop:820 length:696 start_codon:yes stop_codon:yes gene_type:complete
MSRLRANTITNKTANGAPTASNGLIVTGVCTATSFVGSGTALTGIDAATLKFGGATKAQAVSGGVNITGDVSVSGALGVAGVLTYEDVTNVDSIGVITARDGLRVTGIATATAFHGDGSQLTGISIGIQTEAITPSGITTHLLLSKDDHKVLATGNVTIDVTGGTEGDSHTVRIENVGVSTVGFSTAFLFPSGGTPALPTTSGAISILSFTVHKAGAAGTSLLTGVSVNFS